ncbi:cytidylyltransferase domain-containing protein [Idiomarina xiamenensis]|uniref:N-acylneuraminate cytidylyltransferase n=1 Tax=Idiomarina xiamenensis 10-D-4 TaxID=740709 RepID=K2JZF6_9GAMM|nr:acylneuraminate cytidylyltransferase family protein [Idiomarina xiamenensis]EKE80838.1 N-acylneuraminate cytidylyltransferase [Idiomarina xiamenensis 10-D-4]
MQTTFAFIFARGGSKGLPRKNLLSLMGKPLLQRAIESAQAVAEIEQVFVSTDDDEIAALAQQCGAELIRRPPELAQDRSPEWLAWQHAINHVRAQGRDFQRFISVPTTSPLRATDDLQRCLQALDEHTDMVVTVTAAARSPYFNMLTMNAEGYVQLAATSSQAVHHRQAAPPVYDMTTVAYVTRPEFVLTGAGVLSGRTKAVEIPKQRAVDIDDRYDFITAEAYLRAESNT